MRSLIVVLALGSIFLSACATKVKVLDASSISMTHFHLNEGEKLRETGPITGKFCPDAFKDKGNVGLIDQATMAAQEQNQVDFITNVSIWRESTGCLLIDGTGQKVVRASGETRKN